MKRKAMEQLMLWKEQQSSSLLLMEGIKGVGKTYLAIDFAKSFYSDYLYLNFENKPDAVALFTKKILAGEEFTYMLSTYFHVPEELLYQSLLIFDEVSFCPTFCKAVLQYSEAYFAVREQQPELEQTSLKMMVLSSISLKSCWQEDISTTMGKGMTYLPLYPLGFDEFLMAFGTDWYIETIQAHFQNRRPIPDILHQDLLGLFEEYLMVGGMPAAMNEYMEMGSVINLPEIHRMQLAHIQSVLKRQYPESDILKANQVLQNIPLQLSKPNHKFQFNLIRKGTSYNMYKDAINLLMDNGIALRLNARKNEQSFKLYLPDTGMLYSLLPKEEWCLPDGEEMSLKNKKALLENYIMQELVSHSEYQVFFWESKSQAKLEFVLRNELGNIPLELRVEERKHSKSLNIYTSTHTCPYALRISAKNFNTTDAIKNVPYYAIFCL